MKFKEPRKLIIIIIIIITSTKLCTEQNTFVSYYKTSTCFGTEVPSSGSRSVQRNVGPRRQYSYYVAFTGVITLLCTEQLLDDGISVPKHVGVL
jgi:hypothetical protein